MKKTILITLLLSGFHLNLNAAGKVIVVPLSATPIEYTGINPIVVNESTKTITFNKPAPLPDSNIQPTLVLHYSIALVGQYPNRSSQYPLLGEIALFGYNFAPRGWAFCEGQLLPISQYSALFSVLGTTYGGDGRTTFALPDLRGRVVIGAGTGNGLSPRKYGARFGSETESY